MDEPEPHSNCPAVLLRRTFLIGAAALSGCTIVAEDTSERAPDPTPSSMRPIADAHVHLFNAADLPVAKFVEYVVIPERAPGTPGWALAVVDLFVTVIKPLAITARREARNLNSKAGASREDVTPDRFSESVALRIDDVVSAADSRSGSNEDIALADSYSLLADLIAEDTRTESSPGDDRDSGRGGRSSATESPVVRTAFARIALKAIGADPVPPGETLEENRSDERGGFFSQAARMVGWGYLMCQSRQNHLNRYMVDLSAPAARPRLVINHLVDYDRWLGDAPLRGSDHLDQIALLRRLADGNRSGVEIATFAGFCPLKHAMEKVTGRGPTTLSKLQAAFRRGDIRGFKIYPPMGFQPIGNGELSDQDFAPHSGIGDRALKQWQRVSQGSLGAALDASLNQFYAWCIANNAPVMAHSGPGNQAGPGFGQRAHPKWWAQVVSRYPTLRLNMGHLVNDARPFINAVSSGTTPPGVWALDAPLQMLGDRGGVVGRIYGDLGYMPELAQERGLAEKFFRALKQTFGPADPGLRHILYGSDWIMLGLEAHSDRYLSSLWDGMKAADYSAEEMENITWLNARRYLDLGPT